MDFIISIILLKIELSKLWSFYQLEANEFNCTFVPINFHISNLIKFWEHFKNQFKDKMIV